MKSYCPNCGAEIFEGQACQYCSSQQVQNTQQVPMSGVENLNLNGVNSAPVYTDTWKNTKAVSGLVCGIISFFICGGLAYIGLGLSIAGLSESKQHNSIGKTTAIVGIVICSICSVLVTINIIVGAVSAAI